MAEYYVGEIRMFAGDYAPQPDWMKCEGQTLAISSYQALYALIGTTYGGDGINNFKLPDLRGRIPIGQGTGIGLTPRTLGQAVGVENVALTTAQMGTHNHKVVAGDAATANDPTNNVPGIIPGTGTTLYSTGAGVTAFGAMDPTAVSYMNTQGLPHSNVMSSLCITYIIALNGIYPSQS